MNDPSNSVSLLREASPYIQHHRNRTFVIAFPGEVIEQPTFNRLIQDIATVSALGSRIVIVHGTRSQINQRLAAAGRVAHIHHNIRVTHPDDIPLVEETVGFLRIKIESLLSHALNQPGLENASIGVSSGNYITAQPLGIIDGVDYGHTGKIRRIAHNFIQQQLDSHNIVLMSPIGYSPSGETYNIDYEHVALSTAKALNADKIIFLSDNDAQLPHEITAGQIDADANASPFLKKIARILLDGDSERVHLLNAATDGALLLEVYTRDGVGSLIAAQHFEQMRAATVEDISGILDLIRPLESKGTLIKRSREQLELEISNFHVTVRDQKIIACVALYHTDNPDIAELACLAVHTDYRGGNRGDKLFLHIAQLAKTQGTTRLLVLTTQTTDWFRERGFIKGSVDELPPNKKSLYNYQRNSQVLFKAL
ncbi:MAG: amino-acid N-acetyltransferase [Thiothrix litoralis]|uniref:amino-acid N-acetyltransferase n=1 Tax=Thiothrix litoralis TaxID=2891210 RepID=UPI003C74F3AD